MPEIVISLPILTGKVEAWRRFCQQLAGSRRQMYVSSRLAMGVTHERLVLVETAFGSASVTFIEAGDVDQALGKIATSPLPFDRWYRDQLQDLHGINLLRFDEFIQQHPLPPEHELLFEWTLDS